MVYIVQHETRIENASVLTKLVFINQHFSYLIFIWSALHHITACAIEAAFSAISIELLN